MESLDYSSDLKSSTHTLSWSHLTVTTKSKRKLTETFTQLGQPAPIKTLISDVSGVMGSGLCAIMGSSGSGKTTFLSAMAMRLDARMKVKGKMFIDGNRYNKHDLKNCSGYVMQDDLLNANFTVAETLSYTSFLRMPSTTTRQERKDREDYVLKLMGIEHCRDVIIGDTRNKGISGGERKRVCVAMELLLKPFLLFLDEPTSGLDSLTALSVMTTMKELAANGVIVMCTIHQPQSQIFNEFDSLILMKKGRIVYQGQAKASLVYFESFGYPCPPMTNPADHLIHVLSLSQTKIVSQEDQAAAATNAIVDEHQPKLTHGGSHHYIEMTPIPEDSDLIEDDKVDVEIAANSLASQHSALHSDGKSAEEEETAQPATRANRSSSITAMGSRIRAMSIDIENRLFKAISVFTEWNAMNIDVDEDQEIRPIEYKAAQPWHMQFLVLLQRALHSHLRRWDILLINIAVTLILGTFICESVWANIGTHKASSAKRQASLFFCVIHQGVLASLQSIFTFPMERALMLRERAAGSYNVSSYFLSKTLADTIVQIINPIIFTCLVYPSIGYQPSPKQFFIFMTVMVMVNNAAVAVANMISCLFVSIELSTIIVAALFEVARLYGGFFISPSQLTNYPDWKFADVLSFSKYGFLTIVLNEMSTVVVTCKTSELSSNGNCAIPPLPQQTTNNYPGSLYNSYYGYDQYNIGQTLGILGAYIIICRIISFLGLRYIKS
eukprot:gene5768-7964_t